MKTVFLKLLCSSVIGLSTCLITRPVETSATEQTIANQYVVNNPNWSEEKLKQYYLENNILPATPPSDSSDIIHEGDIIDHLTSKFLESSFWYYSENDDDTRDVSAVYGGLPPETTEASAVVQWAKANSKICDYDNVGCGPLALFTQLIYLSEYAGYVQFLSSHDSISDQQNLCKDIFNTVKTYPSNGSIATSIEQIFGDVFEDGTFTFPNDLITGAEQLFLDYNINNGIGAENVYENGNYRQLMTIYGDALPSFSSFQSKKQALIRSINNGMPVIWWTTSDAGEFSLHFMNIFGYETWRGIDSKGNEISHLFFKLRMNWGSRFDDVYMDSDILNAINGGFIFFVENMPKTLIKPSDYSFPQQYCNTPLSKTLNINGTSIVTNRLRTGYINEDGFSGTGNWYITMSSKKQNAGLAYLEYNFSEKINFILFTIGFWSASEGLNSNNGRLALEYKNQNNIWVEAINFFDSIQNIAGLSTSKANPGKYRYDFPYGTKSFRYVSESENPTNTSTNKGRVIIGPVSVIFSTNDESVSNMYVTIFAHHNGSSSSNNFGHGWIQIFNNSTRSISIGNYILLPYEGLTMGLWNNTGQHGVHYNLEYYRDLTIAVERTNNSSSSSSSSSSSGSSGDSMNSSPQWSQGSSGVSSWLSDELTQPQIVSIETGRVSLTKVVNTSLTTNFAPIISAHNSSWSIDYNCADFAIAIWNSISDDHIGRDLIQTPANLVEKITSRDYDQTDRYLLGSCQNVGYFDNDGIFHYSLD